MSRTPRGERLIIALIGNRNAGKSSLINAITGQEIAIVSEIAGTTTDPVDKHYELIPLGPVTFYDTAGIDDSGELGEKRVKSTYKILYRADIVLFVNDGKPFCQAELGMLERIQEMKIPLLIVFNKADLNPVASSNLQYCQVHNLDNIVVSATQNTHILDTKQAIINLAPGYLNYDKVLVGDLINAGDRVILVAPIDKSAPKGRLILPQVQVLRDLLDHDALVTVVKEDGLIPAMQSMKEPAHLVITDSQVVHKVASETPVNVPFTTFSILFARYKGELEILLAGIDQIDKLQDGDRILIAEACSHHVESDDIGRIKIPQWLDKYTGKSLQYMVYAGHDFPDNLEDYALAIHCGACMINQMEMNRRILEAERRGVPITNYGLIISKVQGVLDRAVQPLFRVR